MDELHRRMNREDDEEPDDDDEEDDEILVDGLDEEEVQEAIKEEIEELPRRIIDPHVAVLPV